jgi:ketosteroid isomerase-like protein
MSQENVEIVRRAFDAFNRGEFDPAALDPEIVWTMIDAGEHVIAPTRITGRGRLSGAPVDVSRTLLFSLRNGRILRIHNYRDMAEALEAVGLQE